MCIPTNLKVKDLERITGKSNRQCQRDMSEIKARNNKKGRKTLITHTEVAEYYGITPDIIKERLTPKTTN